MHLFTCIKSVHEFHGRPVEFGFLPRYNQANKQIG